MSYVFEKYSFSNLIFLNYFVPIKFFNLLTIFTFTIPFLSDLSTKIMYTFTFIQRSIYLSNIYYYLYLYFATKSYCLYVFWDQGTILRIYVETSFNKYKLFAISEQNYLNYLDFKYFLIPFSSLICIIHYFFRLPSVTANIHDFIELAAPVPEKKCRLFRYNYIYQQINLNQYFIPY